MPRLAKPSIAPNAATRSRCPRAPRPPGEGEIVDEMVRHADVMRKRQKAWNKVGPAARLMKIQGFISCLIFILVFLYMLMTVVLYEHQLKLASTNKEHTMSGEEVNLEKKQNQTDVRLLRAYYRAVGLSEDEISELMREPAIDERTATQSG